MTSNDSQSHESTYIRPKTRQRLSKPPPPLDLPDINENAAERKRVLNVLAQRRYRDRKRQAKAAARPVPTADRNTGVDNAGEGTGERQTSQPSSAADVDEDEVMRVDATESQIVPPSSSPPVLLPSSLLSHLDTGLGMALEPLWPTAESSSLDLVGFGDGLPASFLSQGLLGLEPTQEQSETAANVTAARHLSPTSGIDPFILLSTTRSIPYASSSSSTSGGASSPLSLDGGCPLDAPPDVSADSYLLPLTELTLLRAFVRIATRLGCTQSMWDLGAASPFCPAPPSISATADASPSSSSSAASSSSSAFGSCAAAVAAAAAAAGAVPPSHCHLPPAWQPTASQQRMPHHPLLDLLPWASARDRAIAVLSLPASQLPARRAPPSSSSPDDGLGAAAAPEAEAAAADAPPPLVQLAYDMEDGSEGMRLWGGDLYDPACWEVGQVLFERWWFIFDGAIVAQSNRWRRLRGAPALLISAASTATF